MMENAIESSSADQAVIITHECLKCGYSLAGHPTEGRCPECGAVFDRLAGAWRNGNQLVTLKRITLPARCVKCDSTESVKFKKCAVSWHHPAYYLLFLVNLLIYLIVAAIVRKQGVLQVGLCTRHRKRRVQCISATWFGVILALGIIVLGAWWESWETAIAGLLLFLGALLFWALAGPIVTPKRIDKTFIWMRGACPAFLMHLRDWPFGP